MGGIISSKKPAEKTLPPNARFISDKESTQRRKNEPVVERTSKRIKEKKEEPPPSIQVDILPHNEPREPELPKSGREPEARIASVKAAPVPETPSIKGFSFPPNTQPKDYFKTVHSAVRWQKPNIAEILDHPDTVNCLDEKTGNIPIHIAAQNGYIEIVRILLDRSCDINAVNKKGNSALHMAMAYDYYEVVYALIDRGADVTVTNDAGFPATRGLEGDKSLPLLALVAAKDEAAVLAAMNLCGEKVDEVEKSAFIAMCLGRKKELGQEIWTDAVKAKMSETMEKLPTK